MDISVLSFEIIDRVAVLKMNNPPVNALGAAFLEKFSQVFTDIKISGRVRALLLASDCPGFFSAGDDIEGLKNINDDLIALLPKAHTILNSLEALPLPTVAAINGFALGGGLELALACDFRFMGENSGLVGLPEVRLGMIPAFGGTQRLPLLVGKAKAIEMMFKGLQLTPEEAREIGLINQVFPEEELYEKSLDYARRLARQATGAIAKIKECVRAGLTEGFEKGLAVEQRAFNENITSADAKEGVAAFLEGRKPVFSG